MRIYIAGPITNNPLYSAQFAAAEKDLKRDGHIVVNPTRNNCDSYKEYIDKGLRQLSRCDAIYMLKGWKKSKGARLEHAYAQAVGMKIAYDEYNDRPFKTNLIVAHPQVENGYKFCPGCNAFLGAGAYLYTPNYCDNCGTQLDWRGI